MSWHRPEQRPIVDWPEGRDWRCTNQSVNIGAIDVPCGYVRHEAEGRDAGTPGAGCPDCGGELSRIVVQL